MSVSLPAPRSISQSSQIVQKSIANQGQNDVFSFRNMNEKFLFPFYDELFRMTKLHPFFSVFLVFVFIDQFFAIVQNYTNSDIANLFTNFNISLAFEMASLPFLYFLLDIAFFVFLFYYYRSKRIFNFWHLYLGSLFLNFFNIIFFPPTCGMFGYSIYRLEFIINSHYKQVSTFTERDFSEQINTSFFPSNYINKLLFTDIHQTLYQNDDKSNHDNSTNPDYYKHKHKTIPNYHKSNIFRDKIKNFYSKSDKITKNDKFYLNDNYNHSNPNPEPKPLNDNNQTGEPPPPDKNKNSDDINEDALQAYLLLFLDAEFSRHLFLLIFSLIEAVALFFQMYYNFRFMSESPYLNRTFFSMWDSQVFILFMFLNGFSQFSFYFLKILPNWCTSFYLVAIIIFIVYIMYYTFFQPFIHIGMNVLVQSLLTVHFFATFFTFFLYLKFHFVLFKLVSFSFFFGIFYVPIYWYINLKIVKKVNSKLSPPTVTQGQIDSTDSFEINEFPKKKKGKNRKNDTKNSVDDELLTDDDRLENATGLTEQEKREMFDSYVFQSIEHALLYLRVGISQASPYFVDFSFMRYMKECYGQKPIQFFILQLSSLFPSQHQFFNFCMTSYNKKIDFFNVYEQFLVYQLYRINVIRQSSVSKEVQNELIRLEKMSDDTISTIRGFWAELLQAKTDFNMYSLGFIRKMTMNTKSSYIDAIEKFPNSQQILNSYCRFLCEACGDYIECARVGQKMRLIELGKNMNADHCYHSFVNVFPHYLKKRILDMKGSFIMNSSRSFSSSHSSESLSSDRLSASFENARGMPINANMTANTKSFTYKKHISNKQQYKEEFENLIEQDNFETLINTLFNKGKQRLTIQQIVDRCNNSSLKLARVLSIVQCTISILIFLMSFWIISMSMNTTELMESSNRVSKIASSFQYCSLIAGVQYLAESKDKNISALMIDSLNIRDENLPDFACTFRYPVVSLNNLKNVITTFIDDEMKYLLTTPEDHRLEIKTYTGLSKDSRTIQSIYMNNSRDRNLTINYEQPTISDAFPNSSQFDEGIFLAKFNDKKPSLFKLTLRNGIEYFISIVERLAFEKALYLAKQFYKNNPRPPDQQKPPNQQNVQTDFLERMKSDNELVSSLFEDESFSILNLLEDQNNDERVSQFFDNYFGVLWNGLMLSEPFSHLFEVISDNAILITNTYSRIFRVLTEVIIIIYGITFLVLRIYDFMLIRNSIKATSVVLQRLKSSDIVETKKPIYLKSKKPIKINSASNHSIYDYSPTLVFYPIVTFLSTACFLTFLATSNFEYTRSFPFVQNAFRWAKDSSSRFLLLTKVMNGLISEKAGIFDFNVTDQLTQIGIELINITNKLDLSIIGQSKDLDNFYFMINDDIELIEGFNTSNSTNTTTTSENKSRLKKPFKTTLNKKLLKNSRVNTLSFDSLLSSKSYRSTKCTHLDNTNSSTETNLATYLDCISIENKLNLGIHFYNLLRNTLIDPAKMQQQELTDIPEFMASLFIVDKYLFTSLPELQDEIAHVTIDKLQSQRKNVYIISCIGIAVCIFFTFIEQLLITFFYFSYDAFKQLIMVLPPGAFANNPCLINFLISSYTNSKLQFKFLNNNIINTISKFTHLHTESLSEEEILANSVDHSLISTDRDLIIQSVNPAVQKMTGFPSDQLLGQGLIYLIPLTSHREKMKTQFEIAPFYQRLEEIKSNHGDRVAEVNATCLTDKGEEILVQATLIGIFDKKRNNDKLKDKKMPLRKNHKNNNKINNLIEIDDENTESSASTTNSETMNTASKSVNLMSLFNRESDNSNEDEEFVGVTIILQDISFETSQKKEMKEAKKKTEALINMLIPPPVLEAIRASKNQLFYNAKRATLIKIELVGFNEYIGSMMPKAIMTCLQHICSKINSINQTEDQILFTGSKNRSNDNDLWRFDSNANHNFKFNFDTNLNSMADEGDMFISTSKDDEYRKNVHEKTHQNGYLDASDEDLEDNDEICDFSCIYNIRNDIDNFIFIAGLFDTQDDLQKQAESAVRFALNIKKIFENGELEEQFNLFIHARIVVCMGGPVEGIVEDPSKPHIDIITSLIKEADKIKDLGDLDVVYINEAVYDNMVKENYEVEEKILEIKDDALDEEENQFVLNSNKVYQVNKCLRKKKKEGDDVSRLLNNNVNISDINMFVIHSDSK